jgi:UDP-glucose 4-epimerase
MCEKVTDKKAPTIIGDRREGDPAILYAKADLAKEVLGWEPTIKFNDGVKKVVAWYQR